MVVAWASALCRAGLNLIDRQQIGRKGLSIVRVNFLNNAIPALLLLCAASMYLRSWGEPLGWLLDWKAVVFSGLVQLVAYAYSHAFRSLTVNQVTVSGKLSDLFIPLGILCITGEWNAETYAFAVATTVACVPLLWRHGAVERRHGFIARAAIVCAALTLQATVSPWLFSPGQGPSARSSGNLLAFAVAVMAWRALWSSMPLLVLAHARAPSGPSQPMGLLFGVRALLTVATQVTFIYAITSAASAVAWPILNTTGLMAMALSALLLREKPSRLEAFVIVTITLLALARYLTLP
ncbi:EamA-like transporter family protein [Paracidovorax cattleyae]|uniref:EamA-like transporter family protein n=2 Tax=Paracidovorax cattleyae TaxID=80868 RepID=A0A1H0K176_9BURK|nr:hypothetical protein C8240_06030 [Paracidovorax cattleyae]SDO49609.1 EamA-like transporter family protein [Paracidovorax cattleyae]